MANSAALIFIAVYLLAVVYHGNGNKLLSELQNDKAFIPWIIAVIVLYQIHKTNALGSLGNELLVLVAVALLLNKGTKVFSSVSNYFSGVPQA